MKLKDILLGKPIASSSISQLLNRKMPGFLAYPMYSSGTVSSAVYASGVLFLSGCVSGKTALAVGLAFIGICLLCYLIINAYPNGGTCYSIVSYSLPSPQWAAFASVSMLSVYTVTLAIAVSAAANILTDIFPPLKESGLGIALLLIIILMYSNMRGTGRLMALLSAGGYIFVLLAAAMILGTVFAVGSGNLPRVSLGKTNEIKAFLFCFAALSGIMSVPERNELSGSKASPVSVLCASGIITLCLFFGFVWLDRFAAVSSLKYTVFYQAVKASAGGGFVGIILFVSAVMVLLAAGYSCFRDFPRLVAVMAEGKLAPRPMKTPGDNMTYSNGIVLLAVLAAVPVLIFRLNICKMMPFLGVFQFSAFALMLFAVGLGYVRKKEYMLSALSLAGAAAVLSFSFILTVKCWQSGTGFAVLALIAFVYTACKIREHYILLEKELTLNKENFEYPMQYKTTALILTSGIHRGVIPAISYAKSISNDTRALFIAADEEETRQIKADWEDFSMGVPLVIMESPYRSIVNPVLKYVREAKKERPGYMINVIIPEVVFRKTFSKMLHNKVALVLRLILSFQKDVIVTHVSYYPHIERQGDRNE